MASALTIEDINKEWSSECDINIASLDTETAKIPRLHNKYYALYVDSNMVGRVLKSEHDILVRQKTEYYSGIMDPNEVKRLGWKPLNLKILKADVGRYVESDPDIIRSALKIATRDAATKYLEDIVKQISNRNFQIKNIIDFMRFKNGA